MTALRMFLAGTAFVLATPVNADTCAQVANDTAAEMRAGATGWWTEDVENLVRAAAGSACVKTLSGRYATPVRAEDPPDVNATPSPGYNATEQKQADVEGAKGGATAETDSAAQADDGTWSFGGLTFRSMSGSPGQKSYERQRKNENEDEDESQDEPH